MGSVAPTAERGKPLIKRAFLRLWGRRTLREASALVHSTLYERADLLAEGGRPETLVDMPLPLELPPRSGMPPSPIARRSSTSGGLTRSRGSTA